MRTSVSFVVEKLTLLPRHLEARTIAYKAAEKYTNSRWVLGNRQDGRGGDWRGDLYTLLWSSPFRFVFQPKLGSSVKDSALSKNHEIKDRNKDGLVDGNQLPKPPRMSGV